MCAQMHWNENRFREFKKLPDRKTPDAGKRAKGKSRIYWLTKATSSWFYFVVREQLKN